MIYVIINDRLYCGESIQQIYQMHFMIVVEDNQMSLEAFEINLEIKKF